MSVRFRATVRSTRTRSFGWAWVAAADDENGTTRAIRYGYADTMPDALAEAHTGLFSIRQQLDDEVNAERAGRRITHHAAQATRLALEALNLIDPHTMEPTA